MPKSKKREPRRSKKAKKGSSDKKDINNVNKQIKHIGIICGSFAIFQAIILFGLALTGIICNFVPCGDNSIAKSFNYVYLSKNFSTDCPMTIVRPLVFFIFCILYVLMNFIWFIISIKLIKAFRKWKNVPSVKRAANAWTTFTIIILVIDVIIYLLFLIDFFFAGQGKDCKSGKFFYSGFENLRPPVGYFHNTSSTTTGVSIILDINEDDNNLNPFMYDDNDERLLWTKKLKNKKNLSDSPVLPFGNEEQNPFVPNLRKLNQGVPTGVTIVLPPMIGLMVAIKGMFAWLADVFLLAYLRVKLARIVVPKEKKSLKSFFQNLFKKKKRMPHKKGKKIPKKQMKKKTPCTCGQKPHKPTKKPRKKCE